LRCVDKNMRYSKVVDGSPRFLPAAFLALGTSNVAVGDAVTKVKPADSKPFIGTWSMAFPAGAGVIANRPDVACDNPAVINAGSNDMIFIRTPKGDAGNWAIKSIGGRNVRRRDNGFDQTLVADRIDADHFLPGGKDASVIKTDWTRAKQWTRCK
jgi:hypothetical protein